MRIRPMEPGDVAPVHDVTIAAFTDLTRRLGEPPDPEPPLATARVRLGRLLATDPAGAWVAERDGEVVGCSLGIVREGLWGLSLLVVHPEAQSSGIGRELLARAHDHADGARGRVVLSSPDPRALRAYARLGLTLHPAIMARGRPRPLTAPPAIRPGLPADLPLTETVDCAVRTAAHGADIAALLDTGGRLLVHPDRGYAIVRDGAVRVLAALDEDAAAGLLRAAIADAAAGGHEAVVEWITSAQAWAVEPCLDAGLTLRPAGGAVFLAGDVGPFAPYLPSGAYL